MNYLRKSKEELIKELKELQEENNSLKALCQNNAVCRPSAEQADKLAEEALRTSQQITEEIINAIPVRVFWKDRNLIYLGCNTVFARDAGFTSPKDIIGKDDYKMAWHEQAELYRSDDRKVIESGCSKFLIEEPQTTPEGNTITLLTSKIPLRNSNGEVIGILGTYMDITERKQADEALRESEKQYKYLSNQLEAILDHIPGLVFYKDKKNNFIRVNKYFAGQQRKDKAELEGKNLTELYTKEVADKYYQDDLSVINSNAAKLNIVEPWETPEGMKWVNTSKIPFIDDTGNTIGIIGISMDITELKRAEEELVLRNKELQKTNAEKDKFFSIIAHDMRSPFNGFLGLTEIMAEGLQSLTLDEIQKIAVNMKTSANNLYRLLENLLEWSLLQRGLIPFDPKLFLLKPLISGSVVSALEAAKKKEIAVSFDVPEGLSVFADGNMFEGIIRNIFSNAVKFTTKGESITVSAKSLPDNSVEISIKDTGIGMKKDMLNNLFRLDINTSRTGTQGESSTGLGLIICKDFIEKHRGKLRVESEEGKGSEFYFTIPCKS
ncbi:MAG: PAS domain-containing sensor histidine kinase [Ignavibacteriae bacterium]|nr:PAS domain-containing sensor histidine kinase [Ignavibacteriota bacterium]